MYKPKALESIPEDESSRFYWLRVFCSNCGLKKSLAFKKGDEYGIHSCPNCDCRGLVKEE